MAQTISLGTILDPSRDRFATTGAHGDFRVQPMFGDRAGDYVDPRTARSLLQNVLIGPNQTPLVQQDKDGNWNFNYDVSSEFGPRVPPAPGASDYHRGIDVPLEAGTQLSYKGQGKFKSADGYGILETTDAQGRPYRLSFLHTDPSTGGESFPELPMEQDGTQTIPAAGSSSVVQYFDMRPNYKEEKKKEGFNFKDFMYKQLAASMLNPMMGAGFLNNYPSMNPSIAGLMDGSLDSIYGL